MIPDLDAARAALTDPRRGFHVVPGLLAPDRLAALRAEATDTMARLPTHLGMITAPWMTDHVVREVRAGVQQYTRLYRFPHTLGAGVVDDFLGAALAARDQVEAPWLEDAGYAARRDQLQNYFLITRYDAEQDGLAPHTDDPGGLAYPLLQFLVLASQPGRDFEGGELVLHPAQGDPVGIVSDLGLSEGDGLLFDRSLCHAVRPVRGLAPPAAGRWTLLIGSRARREGPLRHAFKRTVFHPWLVPVTRPLQHLWRKTGLKGLQREH